MMKLFFGALLSCLLFKNAGAQRVKIPIDTARWYQLNQTSGNLAKLFDGNKDSRAFTGWSNILSNYDAYYPLLNGETMTVDSVRIYDKEGIFTNLPLRLYAVTDSWERKLIATFTGDYYNVWVGPYPSRYGVFKLDTPVTNIRYLQLNITNNNFPGEIELYGTYTAGSAPSLPPPASPAPLKAQLGINGFPWNLTPPNCTWCVDELKLKGMASFGGFRHYLDWSKLEETEGRYTFSPLMGGGWHLDTIYKRLQAEGIEILPTIQNIPAWLMATYPDSLKAVSNNPARWGKDLTDPLSYIEEAKLGFQYAARYGRNKAVDSALVSVYSVPPWPFAKVNEKKIGLGLVKYIECNNEQNKWWTGRRGYESGRECAANLSAFYDGHKNTMGAGVGVKNADSTMLVVMGGLAAIPTDYIKGMIDWCKEFRGYKADGSVNLCFDVINYHLYSIDAPSQASYTTARGAAPELSNCVSYAREYVQLSRQQLYNMPVWITEQGWDANPGSPYKAVPIGSKSALQTQADWTLRSALLYAREGLQAGFFYRAYDEDSTSTTKFASMGLLYKTSYGRKPAADFLYQTGKLFGNYTYQQTLSTDPFVDRYEWNGQSMYALVVPDDKGRTADYFLALNGADSVTVYTPTVGSNDMASQRLPVRNGGVQLTVTETPVFVVPSYAPASGQRAAGINNPQIQEEKASLVQGILVAPNPTAGTVAIQNERGGKWKAVLGSLSGATLRELNVSGHRATLSLDRLAAGLYSLSIFNDKEERVFSRFIVKH